MYLWQVLTRNTDELTNKVYSVQGLQTTKGDWFEILSDIKEKAAIEKSDEEISKMKKETFKSYVDKRLMLLHFTISGTWQENIPSLNIIGIKKN